MSMVTTDFYSIRDLCQSTFVPKNNNINRHLFHKQFVPTVFPNKINVHWHRFFLEQNIISPIRAREL